MADHMTVCGVVLVAAQGHSETSEAAFLRLRGPGSGVSLPPGSRVAVVRQSFLPDDTPPAPLSSVRCRML